MANKTIAENIRQAIEDFDKIKEAIINKGVNIENIPTSQYSLKIDEIETGNVKQFSTVDEMNSSTDNKEGNLALIYSKQIGNATSEAEFNMFNCPETVTLPNTISEDTWLYSSFRATDESAWVDLSVEISNTSARINAYGDNFELSIEYTSEDGVNYTRTTEVTNPISLPTAVKCGYVEEWNDAIGYFIQVEISTFNGLFEYDGTQYNVASSQLNATADKVYNGTFYGKNGVETGTLQNVSGLSKEDFIKKITIWDTLNKVTLAEDITDASNLFNGYSGSSIPNINTSNIINMEYMFSFSNVLTIPILDMSNVTDADYMFSNNSVLLNVPELDFKNVNTAKGMFTNCVSLTTVNIKNLNNVTDISNLFYNCSNLENIPEFNLENATTVRTMFSGCSKIKEVIMTITDKCTITQDLFSNCTALTKAPSLNTGNVTNMMEMFENCTSLVNLPLYNTSSVVYIYNAFKGCTALSEDSLNNILAMCVSATNVSASNKTLKHTGLTQEQATTCTTLSNYQAFLDAGWTTGY